jgi:hypothetical protein
MRLPMKSLMGIILAGAGVAGAHLVAGSLTINGGAAVAAGANVSVGWNISTAHPNTTINIDISSDGGNTWKPLKDGIPAPTGQGTSKVDVPSEATSHAKIRVCQGTPSTCAPIKVSQPSSPPYTLISNEFTISGTSAINASAGPAYALGFEAGSGKLVAAFELAQGESVVLQAVDFQGRVLATLLDQAFQAGAQKISLDLPKELASSSTLLFRLKLGETVRTQAIIRH